MTEMRKLLVQPYICDDCNSGGKDGKFGKLLPGKSWFKIRLEMLEFLYLKTSQTVWEIQFSFL